MSILKSSVLALCLIATAMAQATPDNVALQAVSRGINQFSSQFFQAVSEQQTGNLILSPLSAYMALAAVAYGAGGETERQMRNALQLPANDNVGRIGFQNLIDGLDNIGSVDLTLRNNLYVGKNLNLKPRYIELTEATFRSTTQNLDFTNSVEAAQEINSWVKNRTNNRISDLISASDIDPSTVAMVLSVVYFKGKWQRTFDPALTMDKPFHIDANTVKNVPTMHSNGNYKYGTLPELKAQFVELPYVDDDVSMVIILPDDYEGLPDLERWLSSNRVSEILARGVNQNLFLQLPKFKVEAEITLIEPLKKMGMTDMFTNSANFSGISDNNLKISKVLQKAFIEVNEEGSEAAAATALGVQTRSRGPKGLKFVKVNRPFLFAIVHRNISLFAGVVSHPSTTS